RTTLFLLTFIHKDSYASMVAPGCIHVRRNSSPLGGSTLMMSAPRCPSNITQNGPASAWVKSITRMSCRAPRMVRYLPEKHLESWSDRVLAGRGTTSLFDYSITPFHLQRPKFWQSYLWCNIFED